MLYVSTGSNLSIGAAVVLGITGGSFDVAGIASISGAVSGGANTLTKTGVGTLTLCGTNTYTGTTTVSNGTLNLTGSFTGTNITVSGTGILSEASSGVIAGASAKFAQTAGTTTLAGANTFGTTTAHCRRRWCPTAHHDRCHNRRRRNA